jgi:hypothetical protein
MHEHFLITAGGKIVCRRCNAMSKRTRLQCSAPAIQGKAKCKFHGGLSTGPTSVEGLARCAQAKTIHGHSTRALRKRHQEAMTRIKLYAQILGVSWQGRRIRVGHSNNH